MKQFHLLLVATLACLAIPSRGEAETPPEILALDLGTRSSEQDRALIDISSQLQALTPQARLKDHAEYKELRLKINDVIGDDISSPNLVRLARICYALMEGDSGRALEDEVWETALWQCIKVLNQRKEKDGKHYLLRLRSHISLDGHWGELWLEFTGLPLNDSGD